VLATNAAATNLPFVNPTVDHSAEIGSEVLVQFIPSLLYSAVLPEDGKTTQLLSPLATQSQAVESGQLRAVQVIPSADVMYCPTVN
jgi:hypothetical protein